MVITDRYDHVIDDKGRLAIPSQIRNAMDPQEDGTGFYLVPEQNCLHLIPEKLFKRLAANLTGGLCLHPDEAEAREHFFGKVTFLEPDKQGRVIIPDHYMKDASKTSPFTSVKLDRAVTLLGMNDRLALWDRSAFETHIQHVATSSRLPFLMQQFFKTPGTASNGGSTGSM